MPEPSRTTMTATPWVTAMALFSVLALAGPNAASAQSAKDLNCKKCVSTKEIRKKAISKSRLKNDAVNFDKLDQGVEDGIKQDRTFYFTLDGNGSEGTLVEQGPLRLFARCIVNSGGNDGIEFLYSGTVDGWLIEDDPATPRTAGEVVSLGAFTEPAGTTSYRTSAELPHVIAPDGSVIGPFAMLGFAINVFGHDCLLHGKSSAITGTL